MYCRVPDPYLWGLSRTENFSRMRMKTGRLYTADNHSEAARLRDQVRERGRGEPGEEKGEKRERGRWWERRGREGLVW